jgi:Flp pilus assembly secretin CpaC
MKPQAWLPSLCATLAIASPSFSFAQPIDAISLASGRSTTIDAPGLTRVAVGDGRIAGVVPVGTSQVIIDAKAPGHTTLIVWTRSGRHDYDITVTEQTLDDLAQMLRVSLGENLTIEPIGRALIVKGVVSDQGQANHIADVLDRFNSFAKNEHYDIVDAVTVTQPLNTIQSTLAKSADARDVRVDYDNKGNVIVSGRVKDRVAAEGVLQRVRMMSGASLAADGKVIDRLVLDVTQQVDTRVYVLEVTKSFAQQLGIRLQSATITPQGTVQYSTPSFPLFNYPPGATTYGAAFGKGKFVSATFLAPTLDAILSSGDTRVLSSPSLMTMPGMAASFLVGGEIPYIVPSGLGTVNVSWKEYGVKLNLTPTILADGSVDTKITPEISDLDYQDAVTVAGYTLPAFTTSRITTDVVTKPGESIMMAGLLRHQSLRTIQKIPGLSSIPVLGQLFQSTSYQNNDTDVVFVMTPEVVSR